MKALNEALADAARMDIEVELKARPMTRLGRTSSLRVEGIFKKVIW